MRIRGIQHCSDQQSRVAATPFIVPVKKQGFKPRSGGTVPPLRGSVNILNSLYKRSRRYAAF